MRNDLKRRFNIDVSKSQQVRIRNYSRKSKTAYRLFVRNKPAVLGVMFVMFTLVISILAPIISPHDPMGHQTDAAGNFLSLTEPTVTHPMGANHLAQDIFSQWLQGGQVSLIVGVVSGLAVILIGAPIGLFAGYRKGLVDSILMRLVDILYGIPALPLILVIALFLGNSIWVIIVGFILVFWRTMARVVRSETLSLVEREFVKSAKAAGASDMRVMFVHIMPNILPIILIEATFMAGAAILIEAGISFLGFGDPAMMSWGAMLELSFSAGAIYAWWWVIPPGLSVMLLVLSFFYISRGIEEIVNPELRRAK